MTKKPIMSLHLTMADGTKVSINDPMTESQANFTRKVLGVVTATDRLNRGHVDRAMLRSRMRSHGSEWVLDVIYRNQRCGTQLLPSIAAVSLEWKRWKSGTYDEQIAIHCRLPDVEPPRVNPADLDWSKIADIMRTMDDDADGEEE